MVEGGQTLFAAVGVFMFRVAYMRSSFSRLTTLPWDTMVLTSCSAVMSSLGSPLMMSTSADLPYSNVPISSSRPRHSAEVWVEQTMASMGVILISSTMTCGI